MAYELNKTNGALVVVLPDGLIDNFTTSLKFIGKNVFNYGEIQNENFIQLLENFSNTSAPSNPLSGQLWFDSSTNLLKLKVYDGTVWKNVASMQIGTTTLNAKEGDLWFNTIDKNLYINTGTDYKLIGSNLDSFSATRLVPGRTINGVLFDGTQNIAIQASTYYPLNPGTYLEGESFDGSNPITWTVDVGQVEQADNGKIVARNSQGDIWFNVGHGKATSSQYADLAEKYIADKDYNFGVVMKVGGEFEVTSCNRGDIPIGVVSKNPGYMMNSELKNGIYIALKGRVPVKISGSVKKGDTLVAGPNGTAEVGSLNHFAISLQDSNGNDIVEAVIL